jgi:hypothetical protein
LLDCWCLWKVQSPPSVGGTGRKESAVVDDGPSGFQRDLWALPSEELPPGASVFLDMARDLQAGLSDSAAAWIEADDQELGSSNPAAPVELADPRPSLRLIGSPGEGAGVAAGSDDEAGAHTFLEMVDLAGTVRSIVPDDMGTEPAIPDWLWSAEDGIPAAEVLLDTIEQAVQHVNHSEDIRSEELRGRLLDLFGDFAVRRPWKEEERPAAQRAQRLADQPRDGGEGGLLR